MLLDQSPTPATLESLRGNGNILHVTLNPCEDNLS